MENVVFLADKNSNSWDFALSIQKYIKETKNEDVPLLHIPIKKFRNQEIQFEPTQNLRKKDVYFIHDSNKEPQQWWVELLLLKDLALRASANSVNFILPDMYYSRQDRKDKSRVPISARALADSISSGVKRIITLDLHAGQIQGFYPATTPLDNLYSFPEVVKYLLKTHPEELKNLLIISPDAGGVTRAKAFLRRIEEFTKTPCEIGFMIKERSKPGEIGSMRYTGSSPEEKNVLIIDDIIDSGGTLCSSAQLLRELGAKRIMCYATHGLFTEGLEKIGQVFDKIFISNTHYVHSDHLEIIDVAPLFAEAIYRAQKGLSISELFE